MIATVRDLPSIMASWLSILRKNPYSGAHKKILEKGLPITDENLVNEMWFGLVRDTVESLVQAQKDAKGNIHFVHYNKLMSNPVDELRKIETFLGIVPFEYDLDNIENDTNDDDLAAWGVDGLHRIRKSLRNTAKPAIEVLGSELYHRFVRLEKQYDFLR